MSLAPHDPFFPRLCYIGPVYKQLPEQSAGSDGDHWRKVPHWVGDLFSNSEVSVFLPLARDARIHLRYDKEKDISTMDASFLDYDISDAVHATQFEKIPYGDDKTILLLDKGNVALSEKPFPITHGLLSHLMLMRLDREFTLGHDRLRQEGLLNDLARRGFTLPPVVRGESLYTYSDGYQGEVMLLPTTTGWRSVHMTSDFRKAPATEEGGKERSEHVVYPGLTSYFWSNLGMFGGAKHFKEPMAEEHREACMRFYVHAKMECLPTETAPMNLIFAHHGASKDFLLGGLITTKRKPKNIEQSLVFTKGEERATRYGWNETTLILPLAKRRDKRGITRVTIDLAKVEKARFTYHGLLEKREPTPFPPDLKPLLEKYATHPKPTWDSPMTITLKGGPA